MRFDSGDDGDTPTTPGDDIPYYFQYHLENPGADVLIAALQRPVDAVADTSEAWVKPAETMPLENAGFTFEESVDAGEI